MEVQSIGKAKYFFIFKDDHSKMCFAYYLKTKGEVLKSFQDFKCLVENQTGMKMKILRIDNGKEFCSHNFESFLKKNGILHQTSVSYTPEQNGSAERMIKTVVEKARYLMLDANLDEKFWAEAVNTTVYLRNKTVANGLDEETPSEMWTGNKLDINNLRIYDSKVMAHIPKQKRLKWDKKSKPMILVGYSETFKGYRLYDAGKNEEFICRDVTVFEENTETGVEIEVNNGESPNSVGEEQTSESRE